jgi:hypothetical protein
MNGNHWYKTAQLELIVTFLKVLRYIIMRLPQKSNRLYTMSVLMMFFHCTM